MGEGREPKEEAFFISRRDQVRLSGALLWLPKPLELRGHVVLTPLMADIARSSVRECGKSQAEREGEAKRASRRNCEEVISECLRRAVKKKKKRLL